MSQRRSGPPFDGFYAGKRVLVTGHTGFKGAWLAEWLLALGAKVYGFALDPEPHQELFAQLGLPDRLASDRRGDVVDRNLLGAVVEGAEPEIVFHLAAQPLVRRSYDLPVETFAVNVMGTVHLLDALRVYGKPCAVVCVTTDKCYENRGLGQPFHEDDRLGGHDPYSASKAAAELVIDAFRRSYFSAGAIRLASARAGNVIGGGDWAADRIVPDAVRAIRENRPLHVRNRNATRPWQHVLEPLSGYLLLGWLLATASDTGADGPPSDLAAAFNFGPAAHNNRSVGELVEALVRHAPVEWVDAPSVTPLHEAEHLSLATEKAETLLGWRPVWDFETTVHATAAWYANSAAGTAAHELTTADIGRYVSAARLARVGWACA